MLRSLRWVVLALVAAPLPVVPAADEGRSDVDGQNHVDFQIGSDETGDGESAESCFGGNKGDDHVDFRIDPSGGYAINAELSCGGGLFLRCGTDQDTAFRVTCRDDGAVEVNGAKLAACDPGPGARITVAWGSGTVAVAVVDADGVLRAAQSALDFTPETITATGVCSLSIARQ